MFVPHVSSDLKHKHKRLTAIKMEIMKTLEMEHINTYKHKRLTAIKIGKHENIRNGTHEYI